MPRSSTFRMIPESVSLGQSGDKVPAVRTRDFSRDKPNNSTLNEGAVEAVGLARQLKHRASSDLLVCRPSIPPAEAPLAVDVTREPWQQLCELQTALEYGVENSKALFEYSSSEVPEQMLSVRLEENRLQGLIPSRSFQSRYPQPVRTPSELGRHSHRAEEQALRT